MEVGSIKERKFFDGINWEDLRKQKQWLVFAASKERYADQAEGLIHLIDGIQDYAADALGFSGEDVFGPDSKE